MWTVAVNGQPPIGANGKFVATYEARYGFFNALNEPDLIEKPTFEIGVRYMFGGSTAQGMLDAGMIGLPYLPLRASVWTPLMD